MVESDFFQNICRICASETNGILIYSNEGKESCLEDKIQKYLSIKVSLQDALPKVVCLSCSDKLSEIQTFASMAKRTQEKLLASLVKPPPPDTADDDIIDSIEEEDEPRSPCDESKGSLLHSILTNGGLNNTNNEDVTKLEVTLDPMLFLADEDDLDEDEDGSISPNHSDGDGVIGDIRPVNEMPPVVHLATRPTPVLTSVTPSSPAKAYQCTLCYRGFLSDLGLQNHMWSHIPFPRRLQATGATPPEPKKCECSVCGRVYPTMSTLRAHQITHSNLRPHKCNLCDKTFKRNQDLKFHINQHTGERPYRCPYCPKAFASSGNCFSHRKRMHPKQLARDKNKRQQKSALSHN